MQVEYKNGEIWTVGLDGHIKSWYYDTIDQADPPDTDRVVMIEPVYKFHIDNVKFMCVVKQKEDPDHTLFYAQVGKRMIWLFLLEVVVFRMPMVGFGI